MSYMGSSPFHFWQYKQQQGWKAPECNSATKPSVQMQFKPITGEEKGASFILPHSVFGQQHNAICYLELTGYNNEEEQSFSTAKTIFF